MKEINVLVIAGYGQDAHKSEPHRYFIIQSTNFAIKLGVDLVLAIGGATNPDFPDRTEADATLQVISEAFGHYLPAPINCLGEGDTSADTLKAAKREIERYRKCHYRYKIDTLILACEVSRSAGFLMDSLYVGLSQLARRVIVYTEPFPETPEEFENQKKKLLVKLLSHRYPFFHWLRYLNQKRHQRKVAKIKRGLKSNPPRP